MRQLGAKLTDSEINLLVKEADVDGDGQVDINEASQHHHHHTSSVMHTHTVHCVLVVDLSPPTPSFKHVDKAWGRGCAACTSSIVSISVASQILKATDRRARTSRNQSLRALPT